MNNIVMKVQLILVATLLLVLFCPQGSSSEFPDEYPENRISEILVGETAYYTVIDEFDLDMQLVNYFRNPYDRYLNFTGRFDIPWIFQQENSRILGINGSSWLYIPKNCYSVAFWRNSTALEPFIITLQGIQYNAVEKSNGVYSISQELMGYEFPYIDVELRIPLKKGQDKIKILNYDPMPDSQFEDSEYYIFRWEFTAREVPYNHTTGMFHVKYTYEFPWPDYTNPFGWTILGIIIGVPITKGMEKTGLLFRKKKDSKDSNGKKKKKNTRKSKKK